MWIFHNGNSTMVRTPKNVYKLSCDHLRWGYATWDGGMPLEIGGMPLEIGGMPLEIGGYAIVWTLGTNMRRDHASRCDYSKHVWVKLVATVAFTLIYLYKQFYIQEHTLDWKCQMSKTLRKAGIMNDFDYGEQFLNSMKNFNLSKKRLMNLGWQIHVFMKDTLEV